MNNTIILTIIVASLSLGLMIGHNIKKPEETIRFVSHFQDPKIGIDFNINGEFYRVTGIDWGMKYSYEQRETVPELTLNFEKLNK